MLRGTLLQLTETELVQALEPYGSCSLSSRDPDTPVPLFSEIGNRRYRWLGTLNRYQAEDNGGASLRNLDRHESAQRSHADPESPASARLPRAIESETRPLLSTVPEPEWASIFREYVDEMLSPPVGLIEGALGQLQIS